MPSADYPKHAQVLVIGGGPGGSYTASVLAREGFDVVLFEAAQFPRYHIGESLLPSVRHFLRFIDAEDKIAAYGFVPKPGSAIKFNQYMQEGYTDFVALGASNNSWNVTRSDFDHLLLNHAASCGAKVYEQTRVTDISFDNTPPPSPVRAAPHFPPRLPLGQRRSSTVEFSLNGPHDAASLGRPRSVMYESAYGAKREITFDYLVDASGRAGIMSTKYLKNRKFNSSLKNVAVWGYWKNTGMYGAGTSRENAPFFEALSDESGWAWFIPLHKGLTSVGIVMDQKQLGIRSRASSSAGSPHPGGGRRGSISARTASTLADRYVSFLQLAPGVLGLVGDGELVSVKTDENDSEEEPPVARSASDYSYSAGEYAGPGFRIVGDAGSFIDPFFSSGVHLAMTGGLSAAASIAAAIRGDCTEAASASWHSNRVSLSYTRFLIVVLSAYKQIKAQSDNVLADIEEKNFDKAFAFLRPVIQGGADMGTRLSEDEVQRALDFCVHLFDPTTPEQHEAVRRKLEIVTGFHLPIPPSPDSPSTKTAFEPDVSRLFDVRAPVVDPAQLDKLLRLQLRIQDTRSVPSPPPSPRTPNTPTGLRIPAPIREAGADLQTEIRMVLDKVNARRVIHAEHGNGLNSLEEEAFGGYVLRLKRGELGLRQQEWSEFP
ncbi:FAD/NAD(P)-binding domain-containing protein [Lentinus tigrinus ALCF2SS1-6]|uniref:FAD/NAD(P)-binding domain-containing protein n=1 Tax=Lentinus tigrinus ALCF2SS1-6 TaxID=1328759 RepID=A0A5C2S4S0_9APHY|nr:FAD/NAD(P)-binding domain-containing protein [Lentinus tigrinus ALCF2SS1-6]